MRVSKSVREDIVRNITGRGLGIGELIHLDLSYGKIRNFILSKSIKKDILFMDAKTTPLVVIEEGGYVIPLKQDLKLSDVQSAIVYLATMGTRASLDELMCDIVEYVMENPDERYEGALVYHHGAHDIHVFTNDSEAISLYINSGDDTRYVYNFVDDPNLTTIIGRTIPQSKGIVLGKESELVKFANAFLKNVVM